MQLQDSIIIFKQAKYWERKGKLAEAERAYYRAVELNPLFYGNFQCLGKVLVLQGKLDEAVCVYRKANKLHPKVLSLQYDLGETLRQQGKLDQAIAYFKSVIEANPNFSWAYYGLGKCYLSLNEWKKAISAYKEAVRLSPNSQVFCQKLNWAILQSNQFHKSQKLEVVAYVTKTFLASEDLGLKKSLGYQSGARWEGVQDNIAMISDYLSPEARTGIDVGCNQGLITLALADLGLKVTGYEKQHSYFTDALKIAATSHVPVDFFQQNVCLRDIKAMPKVDVTLCLSVYYQLVNCHNIEYANSILEALAEKSKQQLFLQICCINEKYGCTMPFNDNDYSSIIDYFINLFKKFKTNLSYVKVIGFSTNNIPKYEPFRPMIIFSAKPINHLKRSFAKQNIRNALNRILYKNKAPVYGGLIFVNTDSITKVIDADIFNRTHSGCVLDTECFSKVTPLESNFKYQACLSHWKNNVSWEETGIYKFIENLIAEYGTVDGLKNREDIVKRYEALDTIFNEVKNEGRLKTRNELNASVIGESGGIYIHLGHSGEPIFSGGGHHRLAIAKVLGIKEIPAQIGCVHPSSLDAYCSMRRVSGI